MDGSYDPALDASRQPALPPALSAAGALVRRVDPDRFLAALFAPAANREALFVLYAFNHEIARTLTVVSEPELALIRLAWWREVVEGVPHRHEIATPLSSFLAAGTLDRGALSGLIDAREKEVIPDLPTFAAWRAHLVASGGRVACIAGDVLGVEADPALERFGAAYSAALLLHSIPVLARRGRVLLPANLLAEHGLSAPEIASRPNLPALQPVRRALAMEAEKWLTEARALPLPRAALPAALPAVLARRDLRRLDREVQPRGLGGRMAVLFAALAGRI